MSDRMIVILLIAAAVSFATDLLEGKISADAPIILLIVVVNAVISVLQEAKAEKAIDALKEAFSPTASVVRDGKMTVIDSRYLVKGDMILLEKGMKVPADARLLEAVGLSADESMLTGESLPADKSALRSNSTHMADMHDMVWSSTLITSGRGVAEVTATGMDTFTGHVAGMLSGKKEETPLQKRLDRLGTVLGNCALGICAAIFIMALIKGYAPKDMFITSVSLAVAAIPEGLPATVTAVLSTGVMIMANKKAVVRYLPAVETLGCATVICSDKTGTLTQNQMTVVDHSALTNELLMCMRLCNSGSGGTEKALLKFSEKLADIGDCTLIDEIPFSSEAKSMTTLHFCRGKYILCRKGAPDKLLSECIGGEKFSEKADEMGKSGKRVLAFAMREYDARPDMNASAYAVGVCGLYDPPREGVRESVEKCRSAGIRVVMITGDKPDTALAIAKQVGISERADEVATEEELSELGDAELTERVKGINVFARTTPRFKLRIVNALKRGGEVVAMTGDGVNDAPALKAADIGCAMGKSGTDVAKEASDLILTDDNFSTIVEAVSEGRGLFANIRRSVHFLISCNIGELFTVAVSLLFGFAAPLGALHLLWVNLVTDSLPAIALGLEKTSPNVMKEKPLGRKAPLFDLRSSLEIAAEGILIGALSLTACFIGSGYSPEIGRTMCFSVLSLSQLFHAFDMRSRKPFYLSKIKHNPFLLLSLLICGGMMLIVPAVPFIAGIFGVAMLSPMQWLVVLLLSASPIAFCEIYKMLTFYL